jgi:sporulation protein YunB
MYYSRKGLRRGIGGFPKMIFVLILLVLIGIYFFRVIDRNLKPTIIQIAVSRAHNIAIDTINNALYDRVLKNTDYEDLITIHKDSQQRITMMQANTIKISRIVSEANLAIKDILNDIKYDTFTVPLGQALGSTLLANYGPNIPVKVIPLGTANVSFVDQFQEAGINQVRHILFLNVEMSVDIVVPLVTDKIIVNNNVPIAETIIVGQVPNTYFGVNSSNINGLVKDNIKGKITTK